MALKYSDPEEVKKIVENFNNRSALLIKREEMYAELKKQQNALIELDDLLYHTGQVTEVFDEIPLAVTVHSIDLENKTKQANFISVRSVCHAKDELRFNSCNVFRDTDGKYGIELFSRMTPMGGVHFQSKYTQERAMELAKNWVAHNKLPEAEAKQFVDFLKMLKTPYVPTHAAQPKKEEETVMEIVRPSQENSE